MARCTRINNLEVHHIRRDGGSALSNALVLCEDCHAATSTYGIPGESPDLFDPVTKEAALRRAGRMCQCERLSDCH